MKLTIEETDGEDIILFAVREVSIRDTERIATLRLKHMNGKKYSYKERQRKPTRIVLEFGDVSVASVNYGQVRK